MEWPLGETTTATVSLGGNQMVAGKMAPGLNTAMQEEAIMDAIFVMMKLFNLIKCSATKYNALL